MSSVPRTASDPISHTPHFPCRCRAEFFVFALYAEMVGRDVRLYAAATDGMLRQFQDLKFHGDLFKDMPTDGEVTVEEDRHEIRRLEASVRELRTMLTQQGKILTEQNALLTQIYSAGAAAAAALAGGRRPLPVGPPPASAAAEDDGAGVFGPGGPVSAG